MKEREVAQKVGPNGACVKERKRKEELVCVCVLPFAAILAAHCMVTGSTFSQGPAQSTSPFSNASRPPNRLHSKAT